MSLTKVSYSMINGAPLNVLDFGADPTGVADSTAAIQAAWDQAKANGHGYIRVPAGTYLVTEAIDITDANNVTFEGDGEQSTIITTNSTTADVFYSNADNGYRNFRNFSITSSVTRTAGSYFNLLIERRSEFSRIKMTKHYYGFNLPGFEVCYMYACSITNPATNGIGIVLGTDVAQSGSGITLDSLLIRCNDDVVQGVPVGLYGILINSVDAVFAVNCDIGGGGVNDVRFNVATRSANHWFVQCFFDATQLGDCVTVVGAGVLVHSTFTGCWFGGAGNATVTGNAEACGIRLTQIGGYQDVNFNGCDFLICAGTGALIEAVGADFAFNSCNFNYCGTRATTNKFGMWVVPASTQTVGMTITGCKFSANGGVGLKLDQHAALNVLSGNNSSDGISIYPGANTNGSCAGNLDSTITSSSTIASANVITVSPVANFFKVTGTTNIAGITATYPGHIITLKFAGILTVISGSTNLLLAGNFTTAANNTLTLMCDYLGNWNEISRALVTV